MRNADREHFDNIDSLNDFIEPERPIDDFLVCECSCVSLKSINQFFEEFPNANLEDLKKSLKVGVGCGSCVKNYKFLSTKE